MFGVAHAILEIAFKKKSRGWAFQIFNVINITFFKL